MSQPDTLPLTAIEADTQIRTRNGFDEQSLTELSQTIKAHGLLQRIVVEPIGDEPRYRVIAGERRLLAASMAGLDTVPVEIRTPTDGRDTRVLQAIENLQRVDLTLMDRAEGVARIVKDYGAKGAAKLLGKSPAWISKHCSVAAAHEDIRQAATEGDCNDAEVLLCIAQLGKRDANDERAYQLYRHGLNALANGTLTREKARQLLDLANAPGELPADDDSGTESATPAPKEPTSIALRLTEAQTLTLAQALTLAHKHTKDIGDKGQIDAIRTALDQLAAKAWPSE